MASSGPSYTAVRVVPVCSWLKVKPVSNWSRPRGTTVLAGVKVGRSVLIRPSGSSCCDIVARNRSSRLGCGEAGSESDCCGSSSTAPNEGEAGWYAPAFAEPSGRASGCLGVGGASQHQDRRPDKSAHHRVCHSASVSQRGDGSGRSPRPNLDWRYTIPLVRPFYLET